MCKSRLGCAVLAALSLASPSARSQEPPVSQDPQALPSDSGDREASQKKIPRLVQPSEQAAPRERLSLGVNYLGAQVRWTLSPRWALEGRFQEGKASSDYGDVKSKVFGLRI